MSPSKESRHEAFAIAHAAILERIAEGAPLEDVLRASIDLVESQYPSSVCSVLLLDESGLHLRHENAPHLPSSYVAAIDGKPIGPRAGSCGTAAFEKRTVVVTDIATSPLWEPYRDFAMANGLRACWSVPIMTPELGVLGTFAAYSHTARSPEEGELATLVASAHVAAIAIERRRTEEKLRRGDVLERIAGRAAHLGGWVVQLPEGTMRWSDEVAAIHGYAPGVTPSLAEALELYVPACRPRIRALFDACAKDGVPFDEELQIEHRPGHHVWVRAIGEAVRGADGTVTQIQGAFQDVSERKASEAEAGRLARRLATTLESITDAVCVLDHEFRFTYLNSASEQLIGRARGALLGRLLWDEFPEALGTHFERECRRAVREKTTVAFEGYYDALGAWAEVRAYPSGEGLAVHLRDVSERKRAEQAARIAAEQLAASEAQYRLLFDNNPQPMWAYDTDTLRVIAVNRSAIEHYGYTEREFLSMTIRDLRAPSSAEAAEARAKTIPPLEKNVALWQHRRKDGSVIDVELTSDRVDLLGRPARLVLANDVTHKVRAERELARAEQERREADARIHEQASLLDKAKDAILVRDIQSRVTFWNKGAERLYGYMEAEALGRSVEDLLYDDVTELRAAMKRVLELGEWTGEIRQRRKDGTPISVEGHWTLVRDAEGAPHSVLAINTDVTKRLAVEAQLQQSQRLESIGQLTGGVAHDFNNLLTVILGNAEVLADELSGEPDRLELAEMIRVAATRGGELTSRLLTFARRQALRPSAVDTNALIGDMLSLLRRTLSEEIEVCIRCGQNISPALVDRSQLEDALLNLSINARDAMAEGGGRLTIETANARLDRAYAEKHPDVTPGDYVLVSVADTGVGIPPEDMPRIFDPFFTTKEFGKGTGLGLSMVYGFIKQSHGHVQVSSTVGEGTVVRMYFPMFEGAVAEPHDVVRPEVDLGGAETLLLVEDDSLVRRHVEEQLRDLGYRVIAAANGPEALELFAAHPEIELVFTDVVMPGGMNGKSLADAARRLRPDVKVLYTSGYMDGTNVQGDGSSGRAHVLSKPYTRGELARAVRRALADVEVDRLN